MAEPAEAIDDMREERQPRGPILIGRDDVLPGVAATGDMIDGVGKFKTQGAGHGAWCIGRPYVIARPDPCFLFLFSVFVRKETSRKGPCPPRDLQASL